MYALTLQRNTLEEDLTLVDFDDREDVLDRLVDEYLDDDAEAFCRRIESEAANDN